MARLPRTGYIDQSISLSPIQASASGRHMRARKFIAAAVVLVFLACSQAASAFAEVTPTWTPPIRPSVLGQQAKQRLLSWESPNVAIRWPAPEALSLWAGQSAAFARQSQPAAEIVAELVSCL